jgi:hypothetical protein
MISLGKYMTELSKIREGINDDNTNEELRAIINDYNNLIMELMHEITIGKIKTMMAVEKGFKINKS